MAQEIPAESEGRVPSISLARYGVSGAPARLMVLAAFFLVPLILYAPILGHSFVLDDSQLLLDNPQVKTPAKALWFLTHPVAVDLPGEQTSFYRPLTFLSLSLEWQVWGAKAAGYHLDQILIHALSACLAWWVLAKSLEGPRTAFVAVLLWLGHPANVEAVAYLGGRNDVLFFLFYVGSLAALRRAQGSPRGRLWRLLSVILGCLSVGTKEMGITIFPVLGIAEWLGLRAESPWRRVLRASLYAIPLVGYLALRGWVFPLFSAGISGFEGQRWAQMGRTLWFYLRLMTWPGPYSIDRSADLLPPADPVVAVLYLVLAVACFLALMAALYRARETRLLCLGLLAAFTALPVSNVIPVYAQVADRFLYLPLLLVIAFLCEVLQRLSCRLSIQWKMLVWGPGLLALLSVSWMTSRQRMSFFASNEVLYQTSVATSPGSALMHNNFGDVLERKGEWAKAELHYREAVKLCPGYYVAEYNLAKALVRRNQYEEAWDHVTRAWQSRPKDADVLSLKARLLLHDQRYENAAAVLAEAVGLMPEAPELWYSLGWVQLKMGQVDQAEASVRKCLSLDPNHVPAQQVLEAIGDRRRLRKSE